MKILTLLITLYCSSSINAHNNSQATELAPLQLEAVETTSPTSETTSANPLLAFISKSHKDAKVYFITPSNGQRLPKTFKVSFGLAHMGIAPAGIDMQHTGHHHLLINVDKLPSLTQPLPASENIIHFGKGQTEALITLPPGKHQLQLLLANYLHIPHDKPILSRKISVIVE